MVMYHRGFAAAALALLACGGQVGDKVRPKDYTPQDALGTPAPVCSGEPKMAMPFAVDLDESARMDLEAAMKKGVVVVSYDCNTLRVLASCKASPAEYDYARVDTRERVIQLKGADDLKVNLPMSAGKLGTELKSGRSLDLGMVSIGRRTSLVGEVERADLKGTCEGATHFLYRATLGAFSMSTGSVGKASVVADVFKVGGEASSESSRLATTRDGSLEACQKADPDADKPTPGCRSPITIELLPLRGQAAVATAAASPGKAPEPAADRPEKKDEAPQADENPCRPGYFFSAGICTKTPTEGYLCEPHNKTECREQCDKGSLGSCYNLGVALRKEDPQAIAALKKACDGGHGDACETWGRYIRPGYFEPIDHAALDEAIKIWKRGCNLGSGSACFQLASALNQPKWAWATDVPASFQAWKRGCSLGNATSCYWTAAGYAEGTGTAKDPAKAMETFEKACAAGNTKVCRDFAHELTHDKRLPKDLPRAARLMMDICAQSPPEEALMGLPEYVGDCQDAAEYLAELGRDDEAFAHAKRACDANPSDEGKTGCVQMARLMMAGRGTKKDVAGAKAIITRYCADDMHQTIDKLSKNPVCAKTAGKKK